MEYYIVALFVVAVAAFWMGCSYGEKSMEKRKDDSYAYLNAHLQNVEKALGVYKEAYKRQWVEEVGK